MKKYLATISYIIAIVVLNMAVVYLPHVAAFGESFSPADVMVGLIYLVRDFAQREIRHYIFAAMIIGASLSYILATPDIALASASAFIVGECIDWSLFTFTKNTNENCLSRIFGPKLFSHQKTLSCEPGEGLIFSCGS